MDGTATGAATDAAVEATLDRLRGGGTHVDCPQAYARAVLREGFARHAALVEGRDPPPAERCPPKFAFRERKAVECLLLLLNGPLAGAADLRVGHVLYAAETHHLTTYGRPIVGDTYLATPAGPSPTMSSRLLAGDLGLCADPAHVASAIGRSGHAAVALRAHEGDLLSRSDAECLALAAEGGARFRSDRGWRLTPPWQPIDWALAFDPGEPGHAERVEHLLEVALYGAF